MYTHTNTVYIISFICLFIYVFNREASEDMESFRIIRLRESTERNGVSKPDDTALL